MRVLSVSLEFSPHIKVGGVADMVAGLTKSLAARGHRMTVALPRRASAFSDGLPFAELTTLDVPGFEGENPYGHETDESGASFHRLVNLGDAVVSLCRERARAGVPFDAVHLHDWPTSLVAYLLRFRALDFPPPRTVLTIHSGLFMGLYPEHVATQLRLPDTHAFDRLKSSNGMVSTLRAGVLAADVVTTVSPSYARELCRLELNYAIGCSFVDRGEPPRGILNGIDTEIWNPATDGMLASRYDQDNLAPRAFCKSALLRELGLKEQGLPIILSAGRLYKEKGTDLLVGAMPALAARGQVVVVGAGSSIYDRMLQEAVNLIPNQRAVYLGFALEPLMHRLLSAADLILLPSRRESCGQTQMYAQRYGAVPVARRTGGLNDTIVDPLDSLDHATGILFDASTAEALIDATFRALDCLRQPSWSTIQRRCMALDRSWASAALAYEDAYRG